MPARTSCSYKGLPIPGKYRPATPRWLYSIPPQHQHLVPPLAPQRPFNIPQLHHRNTNCSQKKMLILSPLRQVPQGQDSYGCLPLPS